MLLALWPTIWPSYDWPDRDWYTYSDVAPGIKFIPIRDGNASVKAAAFRLSAGAAVARGVIGSIADIAYVLPVRSIKAFAGMVAAVGTAQAVVGSVSIGSLIAAAGALAGALTRVTKACVKVSAGEHAVSAGAKYKITSAAVSSGAGDVSAGGILNPSEEELILIYRSIKRQRALANRKVV